MITLGELSALAHALVVADREVDHGHMFHTYLRALGVDSSQPFDIAGRQIPMADPAYGPIKELIT